MTGIIDYGLGNLFSLEKALKRNHTPYRVSSMPTELVDCDRFILAGVGHFGFGMKQLIEKKFVDFIGQQTAEGKSVLGICLGMQLLCAFSEEGQADGLALIDATVQKLQVQKPFKIPHIGWNEVHDQESNPIFKGLDPSEKFYFTHSYGVLEAGPASAGTTSYGGVTFCSALHQNRLFGVQFHPEKSFDQGLVLLKNFCAL